MSGITQFGVYDVRPAAILTTSYVAGTIITNAQKFNTLSLEVAFTKGSLTSASIKIEVSEDGTNYYQLSSDSISSGVNSLQPLTYFLNTDATYSTTPLSINAKYIKISAIGVGTVTSSSMAIRAVCSYN